MQLQATRGRDYYAVRAILLGQCMLAAQSLREARAKGAVNLIPYQSAVASAQRDYDRFMHGVQV